MMSRSILLILILTIYAQFALANSTAGQPGTGASGTTGPAGTTGAAVGIRGSNGLNGGYPPPSSGQLPIKTPIVINPNPDANAPPNNPGCTGATAANCPSFPPPPNAAPSR